MDLGSTAALFQAQNTNRNVCQHFEWPLGPFNSWYQLFGGNYSFPFQASSAQRPWSL